MEIEPQMETETNKRQEHIEQYDIGKELGSGLTSVIYKGWDTNNEREVALKILKDAMGTKKDKTIKAEVDSLSQLKHANILNVFEVKENADWVKNDGSCKQVTFIALELAKGGELFDYIAQAERFSEDVSRYYFTQMLKALDYMHQNKWCHRDMKPENVLMDQTFQLKLADFGFAKLMKEDDKLSTILGTESYMSPELNLRQPYKGYEADIFAAAIILFIMYSGTPPFGKAYPADPYFKLLCTKKSRTFWAAHSRNKPGRKKYYSKKFRDLIQRMFSFQPKDRLSIQEIMDHPWMQKDLISKEEITDYIGGLQEQIQAAHEAQKAAEIRDLEKRQVQQNMQMQGQQAYCGPQGFRDVPLELQELFELEEQYNNLKKEFPKYATERTIRKFEKQIGSGINEYYVNAKAQDILEFLLCILQKDPLLKDITLDDDQFLLEVTFKEDLGDIKLSVEIFDDEESKTKALLFSKIDGNSMTYYDKLKLFKSKYLAPLHKHYKKEQEKTDE